MQRARDVGNCQPFGEVEPQRRSDPAAPGPVSATASAARVRVATAAASRASTADSAAAPLTGRSPRASSPTIRRGVRCGNRARSASISARVDDTRSVTSSTSTACSNGTPSLVQQRLETHGQRTGAPRLGRWPPLPPLVDAVVEKQAFDNCRQIGAQAAALAEPAKDLIVLVDEFQPDVRGEFFGLGLCQPMPAHDEADHALDEGELRLKQVGGVDRQWKSSSAMSWGTWRDSEDSQLGKSKQFTSSACQNACAGAFSVQRGRFPCRCAINTVHPWRAARRSRRFIPLLPRVSGV